MQVVCGNCQLSFQAPDGATGLVCPICRSPLRAPDAPAEPEAGTTHQIVNWNGGTLDELVALLSGPAWSARVEVLPVNGGNAVGEVHVIAGGVSDAIFDGKSTHDSLDQLRAVKGARFRVEPRLPNPGDGDLTFPGPEAGKLEERPLAHLMRYCEDYVLTAGIEVWRASENAKVDYRRGEIVGVTVGGIDAPERLAEVMKWSSGNYRLLVPKLSLPETAPKAAAPAPAPAAVAPKAAAAASRTIFGMPALDPGAIAAAAEKAKATQAQARSPGNAPGSAPGMIPAPTPAAPRSSSPAVPTTPARAPGTVPPPTAAVSTPAAAAPEPAPPGHSAAAKTIFGVQASTVSPVSTAGPAAAAAASTAATSPVAQAKVSSAVAPAPEPAKGGRATAATAQPGQAARPTAITEADRTLPTKAAKQKPAETPVWTYVGVGFIFGLALLGVYRLVIVLAH